MLEHLVTASVLVHQVLSMLINNLLLDHIEQLALSLWLQEVVCSLLLPDEMLLCFLQVFGTIQSAHPTSTLSGIFVLALGNELLLE